MKKRITSGFLCLAMLFALFPAFGQTAQAKISIVDGVQMGTYMDSEYGSSITFRGDYTFAYAMNFGEGFATITGTWKAAPADTGETCIYLTVTSSHTGIVVDKSYTFTGDWGKNDTIYLTDGNAGIAHADTAYTFDAGSTMPLNPEANIKIGTYENTDYSSRLTLLSNHTFTFVMNFGEGFKTVAGHWTSFMPDGSAVGIKLTVPDKYEGIVVYNEYTLVSKGDNAGILILKDHNAGIMPEGSQLSFVGDAPSVTGGGKEAVLQAVKTMSPTLAPEVQHAAESGHHYTDYRGAALDSWAVREVGMADYLGIMPSEVSDYFHEFITREHFAMLVHASLLKMTGMTPQQLKSQVTPITFPDCNNEAVSVCAALGIITGDTGGYFWPSSDITRQEAATMLSRLADVVGAEKLGDPLYFTDISGLWGEVYMKNTSRLYDIYTENPVMAGTGNNHFSPHGQYTRQQAVVTLVRMVGVTVATHAAQG